MKKLLFLVFVAVFFFGSRFSQAASSAQPLVVTLKLEAPIVAPAASYLIRGIQEAEKQNAELVVIQLNTPGGSGDAMLKIIAAIDNATVPVCVYVSPRGAMAASAGMYIAESAQVIAMAPQTTIGAAHPVSGGGANIQGDERAKVTNTFVATAKTHAKRFGRNVDWVEKAVRQSVSVTEDEALKLQVADFVANNLQDLLNKIDSQTVKVGDHEIMLHTKNAVVHEIPMTKSEHFLVTITHPEIVLILFMLGSYGLLYELISPGTIFPGIVGAISLLLAFYAMGTLPVNYAGVFLMIFAFSMFLLELKVHSHGMLTIGGVIAFVFGSLLLVQSGIQVSQTYYEVIAVTVISILIFVFVVVAKILEARRQRPVIGRESLPGSHGVVKEALSPEGYVMVDGVLWRAESKSGPITVGEKVKVVGIEDTLLVVARF